MTVLAGKVFCAEPTFRFLSSVVQSRVMYCKRTSVVSTYVRERVSERITLREVATLIGMNTAAFSRYFHEKSGICFSEFVRYVKIEAAVALIEAGDEPFSDIAMSLGYQSTATFTKAFKAVTGTLPSSYRRSDVRARRSIMSEVPTQIQELWRANDSWSGVFAMNYVVRRRAAQGEGAQQFDLVVSASVLDNGIGEVTVDPSSNGTFSMKLGPFIDGTISGKVSDWQGPEGSKDSGNITWFRCMLTIDVDISFSTHPLTKIPIVLQNLQRSVIIYLL